MKPAFIKAIADMIKGVADLCKTALDASDPEKYAKGVQNLNEGVSDTYAEMRRIIANNESFSEEEKLKRLGELAQMEEESKRKCEEAINGNREQIGKITYEIVMGFLTCGISFAPAVIKKIKAMHEENHAAHIEVEAFESIEEADVLAIE